MAEDYNFQKLSRTFVGLLKDKYPSPDKVLKSLNEFGLPSGGGTKEEVQKSIIVLSQFRDAVREVSPRFYRSNDHRNDFFEAIIDALEELEDQLEEYEEEEE